MNDLADLYRLGAMQSALERIAEGRDNVCFLDLLSKKDRKIVIARAREILDLANQIADKYAGEKE